MATVERSKPIPKEDAQRWTITPEEEFEVDQEALDRTVALMPQKMGLTYVELVEQEINANLGKEGPPDKPGITYDELVAKVEPFKQPETTDMPTFYWLFTSMMVRGWASQALEAESELLEEVVRFTSLFQTQLAKVIEERNLTLNHWMYLPYAFLSDSEQPRLLRRPPEKPKAVTLATAQIMPHIYEHVTSKALMTYRDLSIKQGKKILKVRAKSYANLNASLVSPPAEVLERMHKSLLQAKQYGAALLKTQLDLMNEGYNAGGELPTFHYNFADALERQGYSRQARGVFDATTTDGLRRRVVVLAHQTIEVLELSSKKNNSRYIEATPYWIIETTRRLTAGDEYDHGIILLDDPDAPIFTGFTMRPGLWWPIIDMGHYRLEIPSAVLELSTDGNGNEVERLALQLTPTLAIWERSSQNHHAGKDVPYSVGALLEATGYTTRSDFIAAHNETAKRTREYLASRDGASGAIPLLNKLGAFTLDIKDEADFFASGRGWREKFWDSQLRLSVRNLRLVKKVK